MLRVNSVSGNNSVQILKPNLLFTVLIPVFFMVIISTLVFFAGFISQIPLVHLALLSMDLSNNFIQRFYTLNFKYNTPSFKYYVEILVDYTLMALQIEYFWPSSFAMLGKLTLQYFGILPSSENLVASSEELNESEKKQVSLLDDNSVIDYFKNIQPLPSKIFPLVVQLCFALTTYPFFSFLPNFNILNISSMRHIALVSLISSFLSHFNNKIIFRNPDLVAREIREERGGFFLNKQYYNKGKESSENVSIPLHLAYSMMPSSYAVFTSYKKIKKQYKTTEGSAAKVRQKPIV